MSCFQKKKDSETDNIEIDTLKLQIEHYLKKIASLETDKAKLSESLTELSEKVKNLRCVSSDQELSSTEIVTDLLNENAKVEIFLQALTEEATNEAGTSDAKAGNEMAKQRFAISEKLADHHTLPETLNLANDDKLDLSTELESVRNKLSEQLEKAEGLKMQQNAATALFDELAKDLYCRHKTLREQEKTLSWAIYENKKQKMRLDRKEMETNKLMCGEQELLKCKSELENQRAANSDLKTQLDTAKENVQKAEASLEKQRKLYSDLETQLETTKENVQKTEANLQKVERELEERQLQVQALKKENEELAMKLESIKNSGKRFDK